jgi:hypothetical protein
MNLFIFISLVIMGGDGSVINVINALIRYIAKANRTRQNLINHIMIIITFLLI